MNYELLLTTSKTHYRNTMACLLALGYKFHGSETDLDKICKDYDYAALLRIETERKHIAGYDIKVTPPSWHGKEIKLDDLINLESKPQYTEVVLNQQHTAKVFKDKIVVGCAEFPPEIINKLRNAWEELHTK